MFCYCDYVLLLYVYYPACACSTRLFLDPTVMVMAFDYTPGRPNLDLCISALDVIF